MPLTSGSRLGPYEIVSPLGAGGMGEVYRARDTRLDRDVAIKILPAGLLSDEASRNRFRKEAKALSRLSHPHVATLLDFGSADGADYLVMELVPGPTLDEELRKGPLPAKDVVRLGAQLARGLKAAHDQGVIHRDLKPSNLCLTGDGLLKILDFGLARIARPASEPARENTDTDTALGKVVGSPPYMPPEQVLGKEVDERTDIYSVGAVLYELATGRKPFGQKKGASLTDAILHEAPESPRSVNGAVTPGLEAVIVKALDKDQSLRYQTAGELLVDLERLQQGSGAAVAGHRRESPGAGPGLVARSSRRWVMATAAAIAAVAASTWVLWPRPMPRITAVRALTGNLSLDATGHSRGGPSWATDGDRVYYLSIKGERMALYSTPVGGGDSTEIPLPFAWERGIFGYLPRESALLMRGSDRPINDPLEGGAPLWIVSVPGGGARRLSNLIASWAEISPDGSKLALLRWDKLAVALVDGSDERALHTLRSPSELQIRWTPDGQRVRFMDAGPPGTERGTWIWEIATGGGPARALWPGEGGAWTPDGRYFVLSQWDERYLRRDISLVPEHPWPWRRLQPRRLTVGPLDLTNVGSSRDGRHLFAFGTTPRVELMGFDSKAQRFAPFLGGESAFYAEPSPDGKWLAWVRYPEGTLWKSRPDGSERMQLTSPPLEVHLPRWSPDGTRLVFVGKTPADRQLTVQIVAADGWALEEVGQRETEVLSCWDPCWMPDGSIVFSHLGLPPGLFRFDPSTRGIATIPGSDALRYPKCSRQGDLLAMSVAGTGRSFRLLRAGLRAWQDLGPRPSGLVYPNWTRNGDSFCGLALLTSRIECFSLATERLEPLGKAGELSLKSWVGGPWMGLDANDMPLVVADRSTTALYALDWEAP